MSTINIYNYEEYMIDFMEGNLSNSLKKEMEAFLALNPDIKEELEGLDEAVVYKEEISFPKKEFLYKDIDALSFEDKCISYIENQYHREDKELFEREVSLDPAKESLLNDYRKTILIADKRIVFDNKESLKRHFPFKLKKLLHLSSAAAVIFAISLSVFLLPTKLSNNNQLSENTVIFNTPKEDFYKDNIEAIKQTPKETAIPIKQVKHVVDKKGNIKAKTNINKKAAKRTPVKITPLEKNNTPIIKKILIAQAKRDDKIIIHKRCTVSDALIKEMSNELALNDAATKWNDDQDVKDIKDNNKISSNNILVGGKKKLEKIFGNFFYKKVIKHTKDNYSTDK